MGLRHAARVIHVDGDIRLRPAQIDRHAHGAFPVGDPLHLVDDLRLAPFKLPLELRHGRIAVLVIQLVERAPRHRRHAHSHQPHRQQQRQRKNHEEFGTERHKRFSCPQTARNPKTAREPVMRYLISIVVSSQTSASGQVSPGAGGCQSRTRPPRP